MLILASHWLQAQQSTNTVKFRVTYNSTTQRYTAWAVPDYSTPNGNNGGANELVSTAQFTLKVPIGFTISNITDASGAQSWEKSPAKLGQGLSLTATNGSVFTQDYAPAVLDPNYAYYVIGKSPTESNLGAFVAGTPVALFTFTGNGCFGPIQPLPPGDPFIQAALDAFSFNVPNSFYSASGQPSGGNQNPLEQYISNTGAPANCSPIPLVVRPDIANTNANTPVSGNVLTNDTDPNSGTLTASLTTPPSVGTAVISPNGSYTYTPPAGFTGVVTFCYTATSTAGTSGSSCVTINVNPSPSPNGNDSPIANNDATQTTAGKPVVIAVLANDTDPNSATTVNGQLNLPTILSQPSQGTAVPNADGTITYTPPANFTGVVTFPYQVCDKASTPLCATALVTVNVLPTPPANTTLAPVAVDDALLTQVNTAKTGTVATNDSDPNSPPLALTYATGQPTNGTVVMSANGSYTYTPAPGYTGADSFTYLACNTAGLCDKATVSVLVQQPTNQAPIVNPDVNTFIPGKPTAGNVLTNDKDPEGTPLTASTIGTPPAGFTLSPDGSYTYTAPASQTAPVTVPIQVCDAATPPACTTSTLTLTPVTQPNSVTNNAPIALNDATRTTAGTSTTVNVLGNDRDPDGNALTSLTVSQPATGTASVVNGQVVYTPPVGFTGVVSFPYSVCDNGSPVLCTTALVTVSVDPTQPAGVTNVAPVAIDDQLLTTKGTSATGTVASNDSDPNAGQTLSFAKLTNPTNGTVVFNANGSYTYTPAPGFTGTDNFTYSVCDNGSPVLCTTATAYMTVNDVVNQAPVVTPDVNTFIPGKPTAGNVLTNDKDPEGTKLTASTIGTPPAGFTLSPDGSYTYTAPASQTAPVTVPIQVCDAATPPACTTSTLTLTPVTQPNSVTNNAPIALNDATRTTAGTSTTVNVLGNDRDPDGNALTSLTVSQPATGTASVVNGQVVYTPPVGFTGVVSFPYSVCDNGSPVLCTTALVTVSVDPTQPSSLTNVAPVAIDDQLLTTKGTSATGTVASNDSDPNAGQTLSFTKLTNPANGTVVFNANGSYTYTPAPGYVGTDNFTYSVCDNGSPVLCTTATAYMTVNDVVNQAPVVTPDVNTFIPGKPTAGNVLTNDKDPEGTPLTASVIGTPPAGLTLSPNGSYTYTAPASQTAPVTVPIQVCDAATPPACTTSTLTLTPVTQPNSVTNNAPIALNDATRTTAGTSTTVNVLGNDRDPDGHALTSLTVSQPATGTASVVNGQVVYTPPVGFTGVVSFPYSVCDNGSPVLCTTALVTVTVDPAQPSSLTNVAPVAIDDQLLTTKGTSATGTVASNDSDPNAGQTLSFTKLTNPSNGTVVFNANGSYTYTPAPGYVGTDNFTYQVCDNGSPVLCTTATAYMTVNDVVNQAPVVTPDVNTFIPGKPTAGNVLTNDKDPEGTPLTASVIGTPPAGLTLSPNGSYTYTAPASQTAPVTVPIQVCDAATPPACTTSTLTLTPVTQPNSVTNNAPIALNDATRTTAGTSTTVNVLGNDRDPDGHALTSLTVSQPATGTASVVNGQVVYTPPVGFTGVVSFPYSVCDNGSPVLCTTALVTVSVDPTQPAGVTNVAPVAIDDQLLTTKGTSATGTVASNDSDPNAGQTLSFTKLTNPTNGTVVFNANGSYTYTPAPGYVGTDNFTYQVCDNGSPVLCTTATAYMTVSEPANQAPIVTPDIANTKPGTPVSGNVLTNDRDPQGQPMTVSLLSQPTSGTVVLNPDGTYTYTPPTGFTGTTSFCYAATNTAGLSASTCVTINVVADPDPAPGVNNKPIANNDATQTTAGSSVTVNVVANDTDPDSATSLNGQLNPPTILSQPTTGTASVVNGQLVYTPPVGFTGVVTIPYSVCDKGSNQPSCATALVTVTVQPTAPINTTLAPVAVDDALVTAKDASKTGTVAANDSDPQGLPLTYSSGQPTSGTVVMSPTGSYTYTPAAGYTGPASFTYSVCNSAGKCDVATVSVLVQQTSCVLPTPTFTDVNAFDPTTCGGSDGYILMTSLPLSTSVVINYLKDGVAQSFSGTSDANGTLKIPNLGKGVYSQFAYQSGACSSGVYNGSVTVGNGPALPALVGGQLSKTNPTACGTSTGSILINGLTAGQSYTISYSRNGVAMPDVAAQANSGGQISLSGLSAGSYSGFTYRVVSGCQSSPASTTIVLNDPTAPVLLPGQIAATNPTSCGTSTGSIAISGLTSSTSYTVVYSKNGGTAQTVVLTSNASGVASLTGLGQGSYQISSLAVNNCTSAQSLSAVVLTDPAAPNLTSNMLIPANPTSCGTATGSFSLTGLVANATYTLSYQKNGAAAQTVTLTANGAGVASLTGLTSGNYSNFVLTSSLGCASTPLAGPFNLSDPALPTPTQATLTGVNASCTGNDGRLLLSNVAPNQTFVFQYLFNGISKAMVATSNASGVLSITGLAPGTYTNFFITQGVCKSGVYAGPIVLIANCQAPIVTPDIANTKPGTPVSGNVLTNDRDPQGQPMTVSLLSQPTSGTVVLNPDGTYTYTPPTGFTGTTSFCYAATNTAGLSASTCVTINVVADPDPAPGVNNKPIANNDATQTTAGSSVTVNVVANDTDPDSATSLNGQLNPPTILSQPTTGTASVVNGQLVYTPPVGFTGVVTIPYSVCDKGSNQPSCATALVTVTVQPTAPINTTLAPVAVDDALVTAKDASKTGTVAANDSDPQGLPLTYSSGQPSSGTVVMSPTGSYTYTPAAGYTGPASFTYSVCNSAGKCDVATVSVLVQAPATPVVVLKLKVLLQGALVGGTGGLMRDDLRSRGFLPTREPYTAITDGRFTHVNGGGGETMPASVTAQNVGSTDAVVDWVFVELRNPSNMSAVVATRSALVQRDGDVVLASDGVSPLSFTGLTGSSFYVSVKHRNHLGVMTATAIPLSSTGTIVDFTTKTGPELWNKTVGAFNYEGWEQTTLSGKQAMWAGDANHNGKVKYQGVGNDLITIFAEVVAAQSPSTDPLYNYDNAFGYYFGDVNMDGKVKYQGTSNDTSLILTNVITNYQTQSPAQMNSAGLYNFDFMLEQIP
ncbi:Ig-like domain-containing protein [Spirosoma sordidisoli]|nr:Ig-like domain-containing protein [Spirosoma sordidisoli]